MVPAPETQLEHPSGVPAVRPALTWVVRGGLIVTAAALAALFVVALRIDPYGPGGAPLTMGTHRQLGLPPCNFHRLTGLPCPSCGMTTSFALLVRGDIGPSLKANAIGTLLALTCLGLIPWSFVSAARGRWLWIRAVEPWLLWGVIVFVGLALVRWAVVMGLAWWG
jgi:Protein of unknown function (DUF2752)